jgi:hypothetical protein
MVLSDENVKEFQKLYKEHFGIEISKSDAYENGSKLLRLIALLYRPTDQTEQVSSQTRHTELL